MWSGGGRCIAGEAGTCAIREVYKRVVVWEDGAQLEGMSDALCREVRLEILRLPWRIGCSAEKVNFGGRDGIVVVPVGGYSWGPWRRKLNTLLRERLRCN